LTAITLSDHSKKDEESDKWELECVAELFYFTSKIYNLVGFHDDSELFIIYFKKLAHRQIYIKFEFNVEIF